MSYNPVNWVNGETPINDTNLNNMDNGIADAHSMLEEHESKINEFVNQQIPEEYVQAAVDDYISENQAGLASKEAVEEVAEEVSQLSSEIGDVESDLSGVFMKVGKEVDLGEFVVGQYINWQTGDLGTGGRRTDYIDIIGGATYEYTGSLWAMGGIAFYDENKVFISGIGENKDWFVLSEPFVAPTNAKYARFTDHKDNTDTSLLLIGELEMKNDNVISVNCFGDSVTQGMNMVGSNFAEYGKAPYPARLFTILKDNGYDNVTVNNYGHGGEAMSDIMARMGAYACYITEDIVIPASNEEVSLGTMRKPASRVYDTKLKIPYADTDNDAGDYCVYFTMVSHDVNPVYIDGISYTMTVHDDANWIRKTVADGKETVIPKGTLLFTNTDKNGSVNVIYGGINDIASLSIRRWTDNIKTASLMNGGKYIVLGCTHPIWENWTDIQGSTSDEKYEYYKRKAFEAFGTHFIDLYDEFARHGVDYALSAGYFTDKTEEEIATMRDLLANHTIPAEFSYDYNSQGDVHLSEEGYHVIGMLVFDRLKRLNYI